MSKTIMAVGAHTGDAQLACCWPSMPCTVTVWSLWT